MTWNISCTHYLGGFMFALLHWSLSWIPEWKETVNYACQCMTTATESYLDPWSIVLEFSNGIKSSACWKYLRFKQCSNPISIIPHKTQARNPFVFIHKRMYYLERFSLFNFSPFLWFLKFKLKAQEGIVFCSKFLLICAIELRECFNNYTYHFLFCVVFTLRLYLWQCQWHLSEQKVNSERLCVSKCTWYNQ
jgi:hypothetical protein